MKQIVSGIVVVIAIVAGGLIGHVLKAGSGQASQGASHAKAEAHGDSGDSHGGSHDQKETKKKKKKKSSSHGGGHGADSGSASSDVIYYKFSREFVVPLMRNGRVKSLVIININLEADASISDELFAMEPKLRDNIMSTLIALSNDGVTLEEMTDVSSYETIRTMILLNLEKVVSSGIQNVLILDMAKQDL